MAVLHNAAATEKLSQLRPDKIRAFSPDDRGATLVRDLENFFARYVILPERTALPLALWTLMTHTFDTFDAVPYLVIGSPTQRCGGGIARRSSDFSTAGSSTLARH